MGIMLRMLCISLFVGICFAASAAPKQPQALSPEPRFSKLSQQIKAVGGKQVPEMPPTMTAVDTQEPGEDCAEPPPRNCRHWTPPHDAHDPNSPGWVRANVVGMGQLPDDIKAKLPKWIPARTVPFLPEEPAASGANGPCCICPQCGLSFYTPNDYWGHIPQCIVPTGLPPCVQTSQCLGNSHFDADPRVCMCRPGILSSTFQLEGAGTTGTAGTPGTAVAGDSSSSSTG